MYIWGDYHTHTIYTHGTGKVEDNVKSAIDKGLRQVAIAEHSFSHLAYGVRRDEFNLLRIDVEKMRSKYGDKIDVLCGLESNIISHDGTIDLPEEDRGIVDILVMGYHKGFKCKNISSFFKFFLPNLFKCRSKKNIERNTQAYINALNRYDIDILAHLNRKGRCVVDVARVAKVAMERGTYIELNGKGTYFTDKEMKDMIATGVKFIISSDAHRPEHVGVNNYAYALIEKYNIPHDQVVNLNKIPRFKTYNLHIKEK